MLIAIYYGSPYRRLHDYTLQRTAAGQRHIDLSEGKCRSGIYDHIVECESLTLMDCYRPGNPERDLAEGSYHVLADFA